MKDHVRFDTSELADSDNIGAYLRSSDGTLITHTTDGPREAVDVYTELGQNEDAIHSSGDVGVMALGVRNDAGTPLAADGDYIPLSLTSTGALRVDASLTADFDFVHDEDAIHSSGDPGSFSLSIRIDDIDGANSAFLAGTEGDYQGFFTNDKGELHVRDNDVYDQLVVIDGVLDNIYIDTQAMVVDLAAIEVELLDQGVSLDTIAGDTTSIDATLSALSKAEDSIHVSGDQGIGVWGVRNDAGTPLAADGDYIPLSMTSTGALRVDVTSAGSDDALANTAIANAVNTLSVADTPEDLVASPLASRKYLFAYNNFNSKAYIGASGVSAANGFPISPGAYMELRAGAAIDIEFVGQSGKSPEMRTLELS